MPQVIVIQHVAPEGPGAILDALDERGLEVKIVRVHLGDPVPRMADGCAGLVIMGGPMGVRDAGRHGHLGDELQLIEAVLERRVPILGVCLGSQLLAAALGAEVRPGKKKEIGWFPLELAGAARADRLFARVPTTFTALHWHGDVFALPEGAVSLASSRLTACQAFRWDRAAYGLLFHIELTEAAVAGMVEAFGDELYEAGVDGERIVGDARRHAPALRALAGRVFGSWADAVSEAANERGD